MFYGVLWSSRSSSCQRWVLHHVLRPWLPWGVLHLGKMLLFRDCNGMFVWPSNELECGINMNLYVCMYIYNITPPRTPQNTFDTVFNYTQTRLTQSSTGYTWHSLQPVFAHHPPRTKTHLPSSSTGLCIKNYNLQCHTVYLAHLFCTAPPPGTIKNWRFGDSLGRTPSRKPKTKRTLKKKNDIWRLLAGPPIPKTSGICFLFGAFWVFIFSEPWLDSPIPKERRLREEAPPPPVRECSRSPRRAPTTPPGPPPPPATWFQYIPIKPPEFLEPAPRTPESQ